MSVAFRRESDEDHKEPRFELPIPPGANLVTARGLALIGQRIAALEADLASAETDERREAVRRDLRYWHTRQTTAELAPVPGEDTVAFGSRVRFRLNGRERQIDIVGADEADPATDRIVFTAPLATALIGTEPGESVEFNGREDAIEVIATGAIP
ncbi:GreA/GreB family elongation factor [Sphingomonas turrisvirgatae]|uniref:Nucleoside-diphosphate kinase n=1 Tax=Sphingomonas turrisvirgatae TaxID=1888892 RepID=A0A1E3LTP8_9SPHN|nr:GreA/GreB family elongation factor [Sphingomonas turrisvirgatae]ODP37126.1 nucleoside-diphosphate kinase [Sphingomonas turrisvirgatae]